MLILYEVSVPLWTYTTKLFKKVNPVTYATRNSRCRFTSPLMQRFYTRKFKKCNPFNPKFQKEICRNIHILGL